MKRIVLCADDYGLSAGVSAGIRELAERGRLSATGAMTLMPGWRREAPALKPLAASIDVGLHFTLTDQMPLGPMPMLAPGGRLPSIGALLAKSLRGGLPADEIAAEFERQLDAFEEHFGRPPAFIDGHQHVHLLAGVRQVVLATFGRRVDPRFCWLRDCREAPLALLRRPHPLKAGFVATLGLPLGRQAARRDITLNQGFSGFYDPGRQTLAEVFVGMIDGAKDGHLVMLHPGHVDDELGRVDTLTAPRAIELSFLGGESLPGLLFERGFAIGRLGG